MLTEPRQIRRGLQGTVDLGAVIAGGCLRPLSLGVVFFFHSNKCVIYMHFFPMRRNVNF